MPAWIHDRAMKLKRKMEDTYGPEKAKQVAFAVATQQAHATGKSPKTFVSKETGEKERFGTPEGRAEAKAKMDKPKSEYKKTAELKEKIAFDPLGGAVGGLIYGSGSDTPGKKKSIGQHMWEGAKGGMVSGFIPLPAAGAVGGYLHARKKDTGQGYFESRGDFERRRTEKKSEKGRDKTASAIMFAGFADELRKIAWQMVGDSALSSDGKTLHLFASQSGNRGRYGTGKGETLPGFFHDVPEDLRHKINYSFDEKEDPRGVANADFSIPVQHARKIPSLRGHLESAARSSLK